MSFINNKLQHKPQNNTFKNQMAHLMHLTFPMRISVYMPPIQAFYYLYKMYLFITVDSELFQVTSQHSLPHTIIMPYALKISPKICPLYFLTNIYILPCSCLPGVYLFTIVQEHQRQKQMLAWPQHPKLPEPSRAWFCCLRKLLFLLTGDK